MQPRWAEETFKNVQNLANRNFLNGSVNNLIWNILMFILKSLAFDGRLQIWDIIKIWSETTGTYEITLVFIWGETSENLKT